MTGFAIASQAGQCHECGCRYHPGEMIAWGDGALFHADCWRTRGAIELRPYEDEQPVELDLLLIAIRNTGVSERSSAPERSYADGELPPAGKLGQADR